MDSSVTFTEICQKRKGELNPVIVSFQNGNLTNRSLPKSKVKLTPTPKGDGTTVKIIIPNGHEFIPDNTNNPLDKNILALRNRKTNKIKLIEVDYVSLMNSILAKTQVATSVSQKDEKAAMKLSKMFGGKKAQRRFDQQEKLNIDSSFVEGELKETVKDLDVSQTANISLSEDVGLSMLLPPCNREATHVSDVYSLIKMIGDDELQALRGEVEKTLGDKEYTNRCSEFFQHCLKEIMKNQSNLELQVAGILYVELLLAFLKIPMKSFKANIVNLCTFSEVVRNRILYDFCVKTDNSYTRPLSLRDKTICYIITIATICCNYQINLISLSKSSAFNVKKLSQLALYLGLVPAGKSSPVHILKLPLPPIPKPQKSRAKRR